MPTEDSTLLQPVSETELGDLAGMSREVERLTRAAVTERPKVGVLDELLPQHIAARIERPGDTLVLTDLEPFMDRPERARGTTLTFDVDSFTTVVRRWGSEATTLWAHQPSTGAKAPRVVAVLNDHQMADDREASSPEGDPTPIQGDPRDVDAGWGDHRAVLEVRPDPDWVAWEQRDAGNVSPQIGAGRWMDQVALAEFLTDQLPNIVSPPANELIHAVTTFEAKRKVEFTSVVRLEDGSVQVNYAETGEREAGGSVELPNKITVRLRPFFGAPTTELEVWLRYRLGKGTIAFGLFRHRPDLAAESAWASWCAEISAGLPGVPLLQGLSSEPLRTG